MFKNSTQERIDAENLFHDDGIVSAQRRSFSILFMLFRRYEINQQITCNKLYNNKHNVEDCDNCDE